MATVVTTAELVQAELDCREFARQFPTPNTLKAISLAESGRLDWCSIAALFRRSLVAAMPQSTLD